MPHEHYLEVTRLLLNVASDDINRADEIKTLIKVSLSIISLTSEFYNFIKNIYSGFMGHENI